MKRRLTAIMAADVVGYSRLMGADESGTFLRVMRCLDRVVRPRIERHGGRIFKLIGDGVLAEFPSVRAAVVAAVEIQHEMPIFAEEEEPAEEPLHLRIGINLGDLIAMGEDLYGEGVNVAARVEALAEPGGICITRPVRDQIRDKLGYELEDLGDISVKNIARPVRVFKVLVDTSVLPLAERGQLARPRLRATMRAGALAAAVLLATGIWTEVATPPQEEAPTQLTRSDPAPTQIASLPPAATVAPAETLELAPLEVLPRPDEIAEIAADAVGATAAAESISFAISFDVNPGAWPSCAIFGGAERHTLPLGAGAEWTRIPFRNGPELDLLAKARREEEEVVLTLLPYSDVWREQDAMRIRLPDASPGAAARVFSSKRAMPPLTSCGRLVAYVNVVE